jgi:carboxylesterase
MKKIQYYIIFLSSVIIACGAEPDITDEMLDGDIIFDPSLYNPDAFLHSYAMPSPNPIDATKPVLIVSHGYTATTFEWSEFRTWAEGRDDFYISSVLLGGHGRSYADFKKSSWREWQEAITAEYERLEAAGYTNISLLGSSTSCALFLELISSGYFNQKNTLREVMLVDPIVIPSNKLLSMVQIIGPMLGYLETEQSADEDKVYYRFRPQETLRELQNVINVVRKDLQSGIRLPQNTSLKIYKSQKDPTADPVSAVLIYKGVTNNNGTAVDIEMVESDLHVYTRLELREAVSAKDISNQQNTFQDIVNRIIN